MNINIDHFILLKKKKRSKNDFEKKIFLVVVAVAFQEIMEAFIHTCVSFWEKNKKQIRYYV